MGFIRFIFLIRSNFLRFLYTQRVKRNAQSCEGYVRANYKTIVTKNTILKKNVNFNGLNIKGNGKVQIGNNFHSGSDCLFITQIHNFDSGIAIPYDSSYILKDIIIEDNVWLGERVIVLGNATIGEGAIIQAGSVVIGNIPKYAIAGGHPAKVFKYRDKKHYDKLKAENKFH